MIKTTTTVTAHAKNSTVAPCAKQRSGHRATSPSPDPFRIIHLCAIAHVEKRKRHVPTYTEQKTQKTAFIKQVLTSLRRPPPPDKAP